MEVITTKLYNSVKCYWRPTSYNRLDTTATYGDLRMEESRPRRQKRRQMRRIRVAPRLKLKLTRSPRKLFIQIRDAYVKIMMKLANTSVVRGTTMTGCNGDGFGKTMIKECDEKIIIEILKNLAIRKHL
ncbi:hypothetical protein R6Q59_036599 [Mikania micrantha]